MRQNACRRYISIWILIFISACPIWSRDWEQYPAGIEIPFAARVAVVGDIHGAFPQFADTLDILRIAKRDLVDPFKLRWCGAQSVLILIGDYCDRGEYSKEVIDAVMDLQNQAKRSGGKLIALMGNHEIFMLNGRIVHNTDTLEPPKRDHYKITIDSFAKAGWKFEDVVSPRSRYGMWLRNLPMYALINGYFFVHAGLPNPSRTRAELEAQFRTGVESESWSDGIFMDESGPFWIRKWWDDDNAIDEALRALGARGVIFGHTVGALGTKGEIRHKSGKVISMDIGMTPLYGNSSGGGMLITSDKTGRMLFRACYPGLEETILFESRREVAIETSSSR